MLFAQSGVIDAAAVDARRRAGLQAADAQRQFAQSRGQMIRRGIPRATAGVVLQTDVNAPAEEGAHRQHDAARPQFDAALGDAAGHALALEGQIGRLLLEQLKVRLASPGRGGRAFVQLPVGLRTRGAHRGPLAGIERAELDAGAVGRERHRRRRARRSP